jgi:hypothetical protein
VRQYSDLPPPFSLGLPFLTTETSQKRTPKQGVRLHYYTLVDSFTSHDAYANLSRYNKKKRVRNNFDYYTNPKQQQQTSS